MEGKIINIEMPVMVYEDSGAFVITTLEGKDNLFMHGIVSQGKTLQDATNKFLKIYQIMTEWDRSRSIELDKYKFFQKGPWDKIGGKWFTFLGLHWSFRVGDKMKGGWYVPLTKLNISFTNYWVNKKSPKP